MVLTLLSRYSMAYLVVSCHIFTVTCRAMAVSGRTLKRDGIKTSKKDVIVETRTDFLDRDLRIRSTKIDDINEIANMLTHALIEEDIIGSSATGHRKQGVFPYNFMFRKTHSDIFPLLESRMNTITIGKKIMRDHLANGALDTLTEVDRLKFLWSNDSFRNGVEKSASLSNEPHVWKEHNFFCTPQSLNSLFHKMITAEIAHSGEIVGFCEIAMLSQPIVDEDFPDTDSFETRRYVKEECSVVEEEPIVPTIVNLVTSAKYRRRGVGSTVLNSAINYIKKSSCTSDKIALYVEESNESAINMYKKLGFRKRWKVEAKKQWYMVRQTVQSGHADDSSFNVKSFR